MSQALDTPGVAHDIEAPEDEALRGSADQTNENNEHEETPPAPPAVAEAPPAPAGGPTSREALEEEVQKNRAEAMALAEQFEAQPTIGTVATGSLVDDAVQKRNKTLGTMALQSSLGLVTLALDVVGVVTKADESCDNTVSPVGWSIWYTVHAVMIALMILCSLLIVYAVSLLANKDVLTSQVHAARGKQAEAAKDRQEALPKMQQGQRLFVRIGIFSCLMAVFSVVWLIIGIVVYTKSDIKACDDSKQWLWVVLCAGLVMQAISSFMKPKKQGQE